MIKEEILKAFGAEERTLEKGEELFHEGTKANYYYQVKIGEIKAYNLNEEGKEFVQGIFTSGQSLGEPPLIGEFPYPASAIAVQPSVVFRLLRSDFIKLLESNFEIHMQLSERLANRLRYKAMIMKEISSYEPEHRILTLIDYFKKENPTAQEKYEVKLTRQQLADLCGLRVETVIRAIKNLEAKGEVEIIGRKVFR
ncbi:Crp/Fnr family transcriptional regulator [Xanthovirga aplysinae]|uniref:Crp/Fnr family transcriptional regulator n=1 Tax=Xanthovirga aplysinae TaxID=2529853 RepID=UPI0012BCAC13|nr:Crp/Fnr family transcriptional regulator [Xanthovirga aplysinae]MTI31873.1 Crp/Fnr family transcriptional regulator [Xanthovirga aplysinae]